MDTAKTLSELHRGMLTDWIYTVLDECSVDAIAAELLETLRNERKHCQERADKISDILNLLQDAIPF